MSDEKTLFSSESYKHIEDVVRFLRELADAMSQRDKQVQIRKGDEAIRFAVPDLVSFEVEFEEASTDAGRARELEIEIEWLEASGEEEE